jgi:hypothetical protein
MPTITQFGSYKRMLLGKEEVLRPIPWGNNWSRMRVSMWATVTTAAGIIGPSLVVGVCEGGVGYRSGTATTDALLVQFPPSGDFTYYAGPPAYLRGTVSGYRRMWRQNGVTVQTADDASAPWTMWAGSGLAHFCFDFMRLAGQPGAQNVYPKGWAPTSMPPATDPEQVTGAGRYAYLWAPEADQGTPGYSGTAGGSVYTAFAYTGSGNFNNICISWNLASPQLEIGFLSVIRFAS